MSVLRTFVSHEAWKVVGAPAEVRRQIALSDDSCIKHGQTRNWPVVVYEKQAKRVTRRVIGQVCSAPQLYRVPAYDDQLVRAIVRLNLREDLYKIIPGFNFDALLRLGIEPLDPEWIERTAIGKLDRDFGALLPLLRDRQTLSTEQIGILLRFVAFARFRTPQWRRRYFHEQHDKLIRSFRDQIDNISKIVKDDLPPQFRTSLGQFNEVLEEHVYHMMMMRYASEGFDALTAVVKPKIKVLHTTPSTPFVTSDNPARPYKPNQVRKIFDQALPGLRDPRVHMLYPTSPLSCIVISSNHSWRNFVHRDADTSTVRAINTALAIMADNQIIFAGPNVSVFQGWLKLDQLRALARP